jgi:hypothetical protein
MLKNDIVRIRSKDEKEEEIFRASKTRDEHKKRCVSVEYETKEKRE